MSLPRCCADTLKLMKPTPLEGLELACRWCENYLRYERISETVCGWMPHERTKDYVVRESDPLAVARREGRYSQLTKGAYDPRLKDVPSTRPCERCAHAGRYADALLQRITDNGIAEYRCSAKHARFVNYSDLLYGGPDDAQAE